MEDAATRVKKLANLRDNQLEVGAPAAARPAIRHLQQLSRNT
jgi:hypothetical protein